MIKYFTTIFLLMVTLPVIAQQITAPNAVRAKGVVSAARAKRQAVYNEAVAYSHTIRARREAGYYPDTAYTVKGTPFTFFAAYISSPKKQWDEDISKQTILKYHIKSIRRISETPYEQPDYIKKFDGYGNITYCDRTIFRYEYDANGRPVSVANIDENNTITGTAKYKYDANGRLLQVGPVVLKYYPNGQLKSVEDRAEIERYEYDVYGNLIHINFDIQPRTQTCGNRTTGWKGYYNKKHQLIKEHIIGSYNSISYYTYSSTGSIKKCKTIYPDLIKPNSVVTKYIYSNGLLTEEKTTGKRKEDNDEIQYVYEFY